MRVSPCMGNSTVGSRSKVEKHVPGRTAPGDECDFISGNSKDRVSVGTEGSHVPLDSPVGVFSPIGPRPSYITNRPKRRDKSNFLAQNFVVPDLNKGAVQSDDSDPFDIEAIFRMEKQGVPVGDGTPHDNS
ncbi:hypothetical protein Hanom_Chr13g01205301 [Helianthus anomalus]